MVMIKTLTKDVFRFARSKIRKQEGFLLPKNHTRVMSVFAMIPCIKKNWDLYLDVGPILARKAHRSNFRHLAREYILPRVECRGISYPFAFYFGFEQQGLVTVWGVGA